MKRLYQIILIGSFAPLCWLGMMIVHEARHVIGALLTGGKVTLIYLHPLDFARTDVSPNPHRHFVAWAGPIAGCLIPLLAFIITRVMRFKGAYLFQCFAGFCLIVNGCYLGVGWMQKAGDAGDLMNYGTPVWLLILFGITTVIPGIYLWNGLGPKFGFGAAKGKVGKAAAYISLVLLIMVIVIEVILTILYY
ncbi:MAG: hypothetical protein GY869_05905 [Planctomycetes bacterium]|nr:hypothetical protein [Planctomycetota bacterium]